MLSSQEATIFNSDDRVQVELLTDDVIKKIAKKHNFGHLQQVRAPKNPKNPASSQVIVGHFFTSTYQNWPQNKKWRTK